MESRDSLPSSDATPLDSLRADPSLRSRELAIVDVLGEGGSAIVYRAHDARHGRDVAIKVLREHPALDNARDRFAREVRVAAGLRHPHILPLFDSGTLSDGRLFSVMPVAQGRPLSAMIAEGPLTVADAVRLTREVAQALAFLHASGYVHRDVKPDNILVEAGHAVLTDFGVAANIGTLDSGVSRGVDSQPQQVAADSVRLTQDGSVVGTLRYMSPEALFGDAVVDTRTDVYSLGIVLYEMLAGELPDAGAPPERLLSQRMREGLPRIRGVRPDVPAELEAVVARSTALDPAERFDTATAMDQALANITLEASEVNARRSIAERGGPSWGVVAVLLAAIVGSLVWYRVRQETTLDPQRVVVADLANDTGDSSLTSIGALAGDFISGAIANNTSLNVVNATISLPSRLQRILPAADSTLARATRALVLSTRAGLAVTGAYFRVGEGLEVVAEVVDTRSGRVLGIAGPLHGATAHPDSVLRVLGDSVVATLRRRHAAPI